MVEETVGGGPGGIWEISEPSTQSICEPKTALKTKSIYIQNK